MQLLYFSQLIKHAVVILLFNALLLRRVHNDKNFRCVSTQIICLCVAENVCASNLCCNVKKDRVCAR